MLIASCWEGGGEAGVGSVKGPRPGPEKREGERHLISHSKKRGKGKEGGLLLICTV